MTKRDYTAIAQVISDLRQYTGNQVNGPEPRMGYEREYQHNLTLRDCAVKLAHAFEDDNARFDPYRFLNACGFETGEEETK